MHEVAEARKDGELHRHAVFDEGHWGVELRNSVAHDNYSSTKPGNMDLPRKEEHQKVTH